MNGKLQLILVLKKSSTNAIIKLEIYINVHFMMTKPCIRFKLGFFFLKKKVKKKKEKHLRRTHFHRYQIGLSFTFSFINYATNCLQKKKKLRY